MPYLIDRQHAAWLRDLIAVVAVRQRRVRSRLVFRDNSWYQTLTRPTTLRRSLARAAQAGIIRQQRGRRRTPDSAGATQ